MRILSRIAEETYNDRNNKSRPAAVRKRPGKDEGNLEEAIARKAYEIFEERGREQGKDLEHWLEAEAIIKSGKKKPE